MGGGALPVATAAFIAGILSVYLKARQLGLPSGLLMIARFLGRNSPREITTIERLALVRQDLIWQLLVLPMIAAAVFRLLPKKVGFPLVTVFLIAHVAISWIGLMSLELVGSYVTPSMLADAIQWGLSDQASLLGTLSFPIAWKAVAVAAISIAFVWTAADERRLRRPALAELTGGAVPYATTVVVLCIAVSLFSGVDALPHSRSAMAAQLEVFGQSAVQTPKASTASLLTAFAELSVTPIAANHSRHYGKERGKNVLMFVMETAPDSLLSFANEATALPGIGQLLDKSFVSSNHYSTYPYTSDAIFSLLSGVYPLGRRQFLAASSTSELGLFNVLAQHGYATTVYSPYGDVFESDTKMFRILGTARRYIADTADGAAYARATPSIAAFLNAKVSAGIRSNRQHRSQALTRDRIVMERVKLDLTNNAATGRSFASLIVPTIGHGPWRDLFGDSTALARGRSLVALQDEWLGEIIEHLRAIDLLSKTVIVVTSDHGIRTTAEDPHFPSGTLSRISFNVPLLVYAPSTVSATVRISNATSHVDVVPTLLQLLGLPESSRYPSQGMPLWEATNSRTIFFFAEEYFGASGFFDGSRYWMWQPLIDAVMVAPSLDFTSSAAQLSSDADSHAAQSRLRAMNTLQPRLLRTLARP